MTLHTNAYMLKQTMALLAIVLDRDIKGKPLTAHETLQIKALLAVYKERK